MLQVSIELRARPSSGSPPEPEDPVPRPSDGAPCRDAEDVTTPDPASRGDAGDASGSRHVHGAPGGLKSRARLQLCRLRSDHAQLLVLGGAAERGGGEARMKDRSSAAPMEEALANAGRSLACPVLMRYVVLRRQRAGAACPRPTRIAVCSNRGPRARTPPPHPRPRRPAAAPPGGPYTAGPGGGRRPTGRARETERGSYGGWGGNGDASSLEEEGEVLRTGARVLKADMAEEAARMTWSAKGSQARRRPSGPRPGARRPARGRAAGRTEPLNVRAAVVHMAVSGGRAAPSAWARAATAGDGGAGGAGGTGTGESREAALARRPGLACGPQDATAPVARYLDPGRMVLRATSPRPHRPRA